nr:hypothetical protein 4 [bacterium]
MEQAGRSYVYAHLDATHKTAIYIGVSTAGKQRVYDIHKRKDHHKEAIYRQLQAGSRITDICRTLFYFDDPDHALIAEQHLINRHWHCGLFNVQPPKQHLLRQPIPVGITAHQPHPMTPETEFNFRWSRRGIPVVAQRRYKKRMERPEETPENDPYPLPV